MLHELQKRTEGFWSKLQRFAVGRRVQDSAPRVERKLAEFIEAWPLFVHLLFSNGLRKLERGLEDF